MVCWQKMRWGQPMALRTVLPREPPGVLLIGPLIGLLREPLREPLRALLKALLKALLRPLSWRQTLRRWCLARLASLVSSLDDPCLHHQRHLRMMALFWTCCLLGLSVGG